jgi:2,4-dienoyl-CoA reductase-like NADH-dependent reductase (Old Yellow Enzyme family)
VKVDELFTPARLGALELPNRVVMAPLTRARATEAHVPTALMARYYAQRAGCGLIVSEATAVDPLGMGWFRAPGIWSADMVAGWRLTTDAVHAAGGRIVAQLWHMGRLVLPDYIGGQQPIGPSPIASEGETLAPRPAGDDSLMLPMKPYVVPREMNQADIDHVVTTYGAGAENALSAGFDGVEIHGANGYIIDQFLKSRSNQRSDGYGGSRENRLRILREIIVAVTQRVEPGRVGLRISPTSARKGMGDEDPGALAAAIGLLAEDAGLAYVHLIEPVAAGFMDKPDHPVMANLRATYSGAIIQNGGFDAATASAFIAAGQAEAISFGRPFIANPDLVERMRKGLSLAEANMDFAYVGDERGYVDYPGFAEGA